MRLREWVLLFMLLLVSCAAVAENPEVVYSDPVVDGVVQCSVWTGSPTPVRVATVPVAHGRCEFNYADWPAGAYKVRFKGIDGAGIETPIAPDSVTVKRVNYATYHRWVKSTSWRCNPTVCVKE